MSLAAAVAGGVLITPHTTICDATLFLPGLLLARRSDQPAARALAAIAPAPLYVFLPRGAMQAMVIALMLAAAWSLQRPREKAAAV